MRPGFLIPSPRGTPRRAVAPAPAPPAVVMAVDAEDCPVRRTLAGLRAGRDEALDRAAEIAAGAE